MSGSIRLGGLADSGGAAAELLTSAGFSAEAAATRAELFALAADNLLRRGLDANAPALAYFVPGRIEVLGKHTDYAGGRSLLAAVERGFCMVAVPRDDRTVRLWSNDAPDLADFQIDTDLQPMVGRWSNYPMTVARRIARNFPGGLCGAEMAVASDLPIASGMSSSSALMVTCFLALAGVNHLADRPEYAANIHSPEELAGYLGTVENGQTFGTLPGDAGVGTFGGSEDHTAMLCCRGGELSQYSFCPVRHERQIELPDDVVFVVASSGVAAEKTGAALGRYNRASRLTSAVAEIWRAETGRADPHMAAAVAGSADAVERMRDILSRAVRDDFTAADLQDRFEQFYAESEQIIPAAGDALAGGDLERFGQLVDRSQHLTETQLGNQVAETVFLAQTARRFGAIAASAFGAGFGGSVWSLVVRDSAEQYMDRWRLEYQQAYPQHAAQSAFFSTRPAPAAMELTGG